MLIMYSFTRLTRQSLYSDDNRSFPLLRLLNINPQTIGSGRSIAQPRLSRYGGNQVQFAYWNYEVFMNDAKYSSISRTDSKELTKPTYPSGRTITTAPEGPMPNDSYALPPCVLVISTSSTKTLRIGQ